MSSLFYEKTSFESSSDDQTDPYYDATNNYMDEIFRYFDCRLGQLVDFYDSDLLHVQKNSRLHSSETLLEEHKLKFYCEDCERSWTSAKGVTVFEF